MAGKLGRGNTYIKSAEGAPEEGLEQIDDHIKSAGDALEEAVKLGRRNNRKDAARIQTVHDHSVELGAVCEHGKGKTGKAAAVESDGEACGECGAPLGLDIKPIDISSIPLDTIVSDVRSAFWELRREERIRQKPEGKGEYDWWEWDESIVPECVCVYSGYAIAKIGLAFFNVPYTLESYEIKLAPKEEWKQVEKSWVMKNIPENAFKAFQIREAGYVKALPGGRLGNYLVLWGDDNQRDLYGEFFDSQRTAGLTEIFNYIGKVPALYQHAMDNHVKFTPIGVIDTMVADDIGLWTETQLDLSNAYAKEIQKLARKKALGASSGTLPGARKVAADGCILQWPIIEGSFTPTPAEPRLRDMAVAEVKALYTEMGIEFPDDAELYRKVGWSAIEAQNTGGEESRSAAEIEAELEHLRLLEL